jgi:hypothetical protein
MQTDNISVMKTLGGAFICFVLNLWLLVSGLAPSLSFEDSGEMMLAAYNLGIPHPPGYPLNTMIGHFFMRLPFADPAYAMNFSSAFFTALAAIFVFLTLRLLLRGLQIELADWVVTVLAIAVTLLLTSRPIYFRQSVITEVYGLNNFFAALLTYLSVRGLLRGLNFLGSKQWWPEMLAFVAGLSLTNHHTALMFIFAILFVMIAVYGRELTWRRGLGLLALAILGLAPYLYLPWAANHNPDLNWGNPNNWQRFLFHVGRSQYAPKLNRDWPQVIEQLRLQAQLFIEQVKYVGVVFGFVGFLILRQMNIKLFWFFGISVLMTGPVTAYLVNFHVEWTDGFSMRDIAGLVSVFYLMVLMIWTLVSAIAFAALLEFLCKRASESARIPWAAVATAVIALTWGVWIGHDAFAKEDKSSYRPVDELFVNLQKVTNEPAVVFSNWDPYSFPPMYYQRVRGELANFVFVDLQLLKAPWYAEQIRRWYPEFYAQIRDELDDYETANQTATEGMRSPYARPTIPDIYYRVVRKMIKVGLARGRVFVMIHRQVAPLPWQVFDDYDFYSQLVVAEILKSGEKPKNLVSVSDMDYSTLLKRGRTEDRMLDTMLLYYVALLWDRSKERLKVDGHAAKDHRSAELKTILSLNPGQETKATVLKELESIGLGD